MLIYTLSAQAGAQAEAADTAEENGGCGVTWVILAALLALAVYWAWTKSTPFYASYNIPPFPAPRKPLAGHLHLWLGKNEIDNIKAFRAAAGDIFSLDFARNLVVVVSGYDPIKTILTQHFKEAPDRPPFLGVALSYLKEDNHGLVNSRGENWKQQRATALSILRSFGMGKNILAEKIAEEVAVYTDMLSSFNGDATDIRVATNTSVANIICSIIVGKRFEHDDPYFLRLIDNMTFMFTKSPKLAPFSAFPSLRYLPGDPFEMKVWVKHVLEINNNFSRAHIDQVKKSCSQDETPANFIAAYLQKMQQDVENGVASCLDEANLVANIRGLFVAGSETTSTAIYWCVLFCVHHPEIQDKIFDEIATHVGFDRQPNMGDKTKLRYLEAVIRETNRCGALLPLIQRKVLEDFDLMGYTLPKHSTIILNMRSIHYDPEIWENPEEFRPERHLDADGDFINKDEFIPFSMGRRVCPGEALVKIELFLFLSAMFQRFRFEPESSSEELPPLKGHLGIVLSPKRFKVRAVARANPQ